MDTPHHHNRQPDGRNVIEFDLHGILGIQLIDPMPGDVRAVEYVLGLTQRRLERGPDITIRFQDHVSAPGLTYLGLDMGFTKDGFYVLGGQDRQPEARIPFENIGEQCEILSRSGLGYVPMLIEIVTLTLLAKRYIPIHASAFVFEGTGCLAMGWAKGGKTEALLSFANHGGQYVGDEWTVLSETGSHMFGIPIPMAIWAWQFSHIPNLLPRIALKTKLLFTIIEGLNAVSRRLGSGRLSGVFPIPVVGRVLPALNRQLKIWASPRELFEASMHRSPVSPEKMFLMMGHDDPVIKVAPCDPQEIAYRMKSSNEYEHSAVLGYYKAFKFAFPQRTNRFLEKLDTLQSELLTSALAGKEAYKVLHPYPVSFESLFEHMRPVCETTAATTVRPEQNRTADGPFAESNSVRARPE